METNNFFCSKRASLLLNRTLYLSKKSIIIWLCVYVGMVLLINLFSINNEGFNATTLITSSFIYMFMYGMNFTAGMNRIFHKPTKAFSFLTLPVSNFEKLIVVWLVSSLFYSAFCAFLIYSVIELSAFSYNYFAGTPMFYLDITDILKMSLYYMVFHSAYLFGSIFFKKAQFLKTSLSLIVLFTIIIIALLLSYKFVIHDIWRSEIKFLQKFDIVYPRISNIHFISIITYYVTPILLLIATYFRIKEKEI